MPYPVFSKRCCNPEHELCATKNKNIHMHKRKISESTHYDITNLNYAGFRNATSEKEEYIRMKKKIKSSKTLDYGSILDWAIDNILPFSFLKILIDIYSTSSEGRQNILMKKNRLGFTPLESLLNLVYLKKKSKHFNGDNYIEKAIYYLIQACPEAITSSVPFSSSFTVSSSSPLVRFLSISPSTYDKDLDETIFSVTKSFVATYPDIIYVSSLSTGNTPLHAALKYHGHSMKLVKLLLSSPSSIQENKSRSVLQIANKEGQLPLHISILARIPLHVFEFIVFESFKGKPKVFLQRNNSGHTPISLLWKMIADDNILYHRKQVSLPFHSSDYTIALTHIMRNVKENRKISSSFNSPSSDILQLLFGSLWSNYLKLLLYAVHHCRNFTESGSNLKRSSKKILRLVHAASITAHPEILQIALIIFPNQVMERDEYGKLPLHYAVMNCRMINKVELLSSTLHDLPGYQLLINAFSQAAKIGDLNYRLPIHIALDDHNINNEHNPHSDKGKKFIKMVQKLVECYPESMERRDPRSFLYPFMQAATLPDCQSSFNIIFNLIRSAPTLVSSGIIVS